MAKLADIQAQSDWKQMLEGQPQNLAILLFMGFGAAALLHPGPDEATLLGVSAKGWGLASIWLTILHQIIAALVFRLQLHRNLMSRLFADQDMKIWAMLFTPLLLARPVTVLMTGWADQTPISDFRSGEIVLGIVLILLALWVLYSVFTYFSFERALGGDHFRQEFADMALVRKGAFAWTPNAMYALAPFGLSGIALLFGSWNALIVALFQHACIWVHMYCTEAPDMALIHAPDTARPGDQI
ncbi:MAG: hypothetical protein CSA68_03980 [Rhodobacterales bacterium]|nr:MAG: hypothetical protein CSA68_03980 [Rhodobacterales bacterium]